MQGYGFHVDDVFQGENLYPVILETQGLFEDGKIHIGDNDLLKVHLLNSAVKVSTERNRGRLVKINQNAHIDGTAALLDAMCVRQKYAGEIGNQLKNLGDTMGLFDWLFPKNKEPKGEFQGAFKMLDGYKPRFTSFDGSPYDCELIRAAINIRATHISKLKVETKGSAKPALQRKLAHGPNEFQTWSQFLYRASTLLDVYNTLFICPVLDMYGEMSGIYTPLPASCTIVQYNGKPYLRYEFTDRTHAAIELSSCGIMTKFQFKSDFFGESNRALYPTMDLISIQNQGIQEGVKSAATYRFMATLNNFAKPEDLAAERKRFTAENFARDAQGGGLLLFLLLLVGIDVGHQLFAGDGLLGQQGQCHFVQQLPVLPQQLQVYVLTMEGI